jgi:hypothetical protein
VFSLEMSTIFVALFQIRARRLGRYLIVTDSMRSLKALHEIKEACLWLKNNGYEIHTMWIPSHMGVRGNKRADQLAGDAMEN